MQVRERVRPRNGVCDEVDEMEECKPPEEFLVCMCLC